MPRVYVTQEPQGKNILPAEKFGEIVIVLPNKDVIFSPGSAARRARKALKDISQDDHVLLIGDPLVIGIVMYEALNLTTGRVNVLRWDNQEKRYHRIKVDLTNR